jgi:LssY C-terminus
MSEKQTAANDQPDATNMTPRRRRRLLRDGLVLLSALIVFYLLAAYLALPLAWRRAMARHPALLLIPRVSQTHDGIPGDPINIALVGSEESLAKGMIASGWDAADAITLLSSLKIAGDTVLRRPDVNAPVSNLYVWGQKQTLAFEQPVGHSPRQRHHVRFWRSEWLDWNGRPLWVGAATFDTRVGFSHTTGQITHHISPNVDVDRDKLLEDLRRVGAIAELAWLNDFQQKLQGRNGGGDPYHTDGRLPVFILALDQ